MLSFIRYTFTKRIIIYGAIALAVKTLLVLLALCLGKITIAYTIIAINAIVWLLGIIISYVRYKRYRNFNTWL